CVRSVVAHYAMDYW
nr:immunoglobulin heavy chain junction region [Mus musculus]